LNKCQKIKLSRHYYYGIGVIEHVIVLEHVYMKQITQKGKFVGHKILLSRDRGMHLAFVVWPEPCEDMV